MPQFLIPALITAGTSIYTASQNNNAAGKALDATTTANDKALADQQAARDQITALQQPYVQAGYGAIDPLSQALGTGANAGSSTPQPDWKAYLQTNPDVAQAYESYGKGQGLTPEQFAQAHYQSSGQTEGRQLTMTAPTPTTPANPAHPDLNIPQYTRPDQPTFQVDGTAPDASTYRTGFQADPGYAWRQSEALRGGNAAYGAKGLLKSGGAIKAAQDRSYNLADQSYNTWVQQQEARLAADRGQFNTTKQTDYNIFNTDRNNTNQNFGDDRSYGTNLGFQTAGYNNTNANQDYANTTAANNNRVSNLFRLAGIGTNAAGATGQAATNYADSSGQIAGNQAGAVGAAANSVAAGNVYAGNQIAGAATNYFASTPRTGVDQYGRQIGGNVFSSSDYVPY